MKGANNSKRYISTFLNLAESKNIFFPLLHSTMQSRRRISAVNQVKYAYLYVNVKKKLTSSVDYMKKSNNFYEKEKQFSFVEKKKCIRQGD